MAPKKRSEGHSSEPSHERWESLSRGRRCSESPSKDSNKWPRHPTRFDAQNLTRQLAQALANPQNESTQDQITLLKRVMTSQQPAKNVVNLTDDLPQDRQSLDTVEIHG